MVQTSPDPQKALCRPRFCCTNVTLFSGAETSLLHGSRREWVRPHLQAKQDASARSSELEQMSEKVAEASRLIEEL
eukprot:569530-Amphidinium_carterae.1